MSDPTALLRETLPARYEVLDLVGEGGMAVVYRARDHHGSREVAVKVFRAELGSALAQSRFLREIEIASALEHPRIVPTIDSGGRGELLYLVMPLIEGTSLRALLSREGQLPVPQALEIVEQVGEALSHAHRSGFIHRDVKPSNILLSSEGAMITDFGVARALEESGVESLTPTGIAVGTPRYMSPEQGGAERRIDARSDQYSLGCVLFEMLVGQPPFSGTSAQAVVARHLVETPPSIRIVRPTASAGVEYAVRRALAKSPADRFESVPDFVAAVRNPEPPPGADLDYSTALRGRAAKPPRWKRAAPWAIATLVLAAGLGYGIFTALATGSAATLNPDRIVVFPPTNSTGSPSEGAERGIATIAGYALEGTSPLKWLDGWEWVGPEHRTNPELVTAEVKAGIARSLGAGHFIDGSIVSMSDSVTLVLRLYETTKSGAELMTRHGASDAAASVSYGHLGLAAVKGLLGPLLGGREVDLSALEDRDPAAIANWLQGERNYQTGDFAAAVQHYDRAVAQDSALALAAVGGALAADWHAGAAEAEPFLDAALGSARLLPDRHRELALGLKHYFDGRADSALLRFRTAADLDPEWPEAQIALGEVHHHYLPAAAPLDSLAHLHFSQALSLDSSYRPPRFHLVELELRRGDVAEARKHLRSLEAVAADSILAPEARLMVECVEDRSLDWESVARLDDGVALRTAKSLSVGARYPTCALEGFMAVLESSESPQRRRWGALLGAHGLLVAGGRWNEARELLELPGADGLPTGHVTLIAAAAGAPFEAEAEAAAGELGTDYDELPTPDLWVLGEWEASVGRTERARRILEVVADRAERQGASRTDRLFHELLAAQLAVLEERPEARELLESLRPSGVRRDLTWQPWEGLARPWILLAREYLRAGMHAEALRVASVFDAQEPISYLNYLYESLQIRRDAAAGLGDRAARDRFQTRLEALRP